MARRYVRDNRGRFASKGAGATARGGRLKTAGGKKRATQTMKASGAKPAGAIKGKVKRDPAAASRVGQSGAAPAATTKLKRSGAKTRVGATETNLERGRRGVASMSPAAKASRRSDVAERRSERLERITERQSGIVARRQINRASNYNPDGTFNQSAANANQRRLKRSQQLQERLRTAATGPAIASGALARKKPAKPAAAAAKPPGPAARSSARQRGDTASVNIPMRGARGRALDRDISNAVKQVKAAQTAALMKPKAQVKAERAAAAKAKRQAAAAKPKRTRTPESLRMSRAKQIEKRRSITTNPAGERASSAAKMAANAARTQERATAFLKAGGKTKSAAAAKPPKGSQAAIKIEQAKGRVKEFTAMKKTTDAEIRKVRQQIKEARSNATTFGAVGGLKLKLMQLQSQSQRHKATIAAAKASIKK